MDIPPDVIRSCIYPFLSIVEIITYERKLGVKVDISKIFRERLDVHLGKGLAHELCTFLVNSRPHQAMMTGSLVLKLLTNADFKANDIDIFCIPPKNKHNLEYLGLRTSEETKVGEDTGMPNVQDYRFSVKTYEFGDKLLQIINVDSDYNGDIKTTREYVEKAFDLSCCTACFDGETLFLLDQCYQACVTKKAKMVITQFGAYSTDRIWKYSHRGYEISVQLDENTYTIPPNVDTQSIIYKYPKETAVIKQNRDSYLRYFGDILETEWIFKQLHVTDLKEFERFKSEILEIVNIGIRERRFREAGGKRVLLSLRSIIDKCKDCQLKKRLKHVDIFEDVRQANTYTELLGYAFLVAMTPKLRGGLWPDHTRTRAEYSFAVYKFVVYNDLTAKYDATVS